MQLTRIRDLTMAIALTGCAATIGGSVDDGDAMRLDAMDAADAQDAPRDVPIELALVEDCSTPFDDNGDGRANEGCPCVPVGATQSCFERPGSMFNGLCRMGSQRCLSDGTWGECVGSWTPDAAQRCQVDELFSDTTADRRPVDIFWIVDTSGSMVQETAAVSANLNRFASFMASSGLDFRVIMIARRGTGSLQVCVPPPLGGPNCTDSERFRHVDRRVGSRDALSIFAAAGAPWMSLARPNTARFITVVTDDDSSMTATDFDRALRAVPGWEQYTFNSIVGYESRTDCPTLSRRGSEYLRLTELTNGIRKRVCDPNWSETFSAFARSIVSRVSSWALSNRPRVDTIQVYVTTPGAPERRLTSGWTYDPVSNRVTLQPDAIPPAGSRIRVAYRTPGTSP